MNEHRLLLYVGWLLVWFGTVFFLYIVFFEFYKFVYSFTKINKHEILITKLSLMLFIICPFKTYVHSQSTGWLSSSAPYESKGRIPYTAFGA